MPSFCSQAGNACVRERGPEVHATDTRSRGGRLACTTGPRRGIQGGAIKPLAAQFSLGIANGLALSVRIRILVLDDPAWAFPHQRPIEHKYRSVGLITP